MDFNWLNKTNVKILERLIGGKDYFNQIHEKTGIKSKNHLVKNLNLLEEKKILIKEKNRSNTFYEINFDNLLTISLLNLINKSKFEKLPFSVKKSIFELIYSLKPKIAILFGSYAKENYKKDSDVDLIFIDCKKENSIIQEISLKYGIELKIIFTNLKDFNSKNEQIAHVLKSGYPLIGEEYFYHEFKKI